MLQPHAKLLRTKRANTERRGVKIRTPAEARSSFTLQGRPLLWEAGFFTEHGESDAGESDAVVHG